MFLAFAWILAPAPLMARQSSAPQLAKIEGVVRDSSGHALSGVAVALKQTGGLDSKKASTDQSGAFVFSELPPSTYSIRVKKTGFRDLSDDSIRLSPGEDKRCEFVLQAVPGSSTRSPLPLPGGFELDDKPNFTVAGITDSTGSGGHAAETRLRTGEALARETLKLKSDGSSVPAHGALKAPAESENSLRSALNQNPRSFEANHQLGELYFHSGRHREAIPLLQAAYDLDSQNHENAVELAQATEKSGDLAGARSHLKRMLATRTGLNRADEADFHRMLGDIDEKSDDPLAAVHEYELAAGLDSSELNYFVWGSELLLHGAAAPAIEVFGKGAQLHPNSARMLSGLGAAMFTSGSAEDAAERLCQAADLVPADHAPYLFLGKMQEGSSAALPCAEQKLERFVEFQPNNALANYYYGVALWKRSRGTEDTKVLDHARALFEKASTIDPKLDSPYLLLGNLEYARGMFPQAVAAYQKAIAANPDSSEAHYRLGLAYKRSARESQAQTEFDKYKQLDKTETEKVEQQRRELRQFLYVLSDQAADSHSNSHVVPANSK